MTILTFGEKLEAAFHATKKSVKMIGKSPVTFALLCVDGVNVELTRSVSHPWFWKLTNVTTGVVSLLDSEWDLPYVDKV